MGGLGTPKGLGVEIQPCKTIRKKFFLIAYVVRIIRRLEVSGLLKLLAWQLGTFEVCSVFTKQRRGAFALQRDIVT